MLSDLSRYLRTWMGTEGGGRGEEERRGRATGSRMF